MSSSSPHFVASSSKHRAIVTKKSFIKVFDQFRLRAHMAEHWAAYLHENYRNAEEVADVFGVRFQTALNWWKGDNKPSGDAVANEAIREPMRFSTFMRSQL